MASTQETIAAGVGNVVTIKTASVALHALERMGRPSKTKKMY